MGAFKIDDYLELRKRFPRSDSPLWMVLASDENSPSFGLDYAYQLESDLERFGIEIENFLGTLDGDDGYADLLCLRILEAVSHRKIVEEKRPHAVASGLAIGDSLIDFLCCSVLEAISYYGMRPPHSFQVLLKVRLGLFDNAILADRRLGHRRTLIALFIAENPAMSLREVSRSTGIHFSTISRWMADPKFIASVKAFQFSPFKKPASE